MISIYNLSRKKYLMFKSRWKYWYRFIFDYKLKKKRLIYIIRKDYLYKATLIILGTKISDQYGYLFSGI